MSKQNTARELSACETMIMKLIWDADGDIAVQELIAKMKEAYGKDYARTTMVTFLKKLSDKGFVSSYRIGRAAYVHPEKDENQYKQLLMTEEMKFWYGGRMSEMFHAICEVHPISEKEMKNMRDLLEM